MDRVAAVSLPITGFDRAWKPHPNVHAPIYPSMIETWLSGHGWPWPLDKVFWGDPSPTRHLLLTVSIQIPGMLTRWFLPCCCSQLGFGSFLGIIGINLVENRRQMVRKYMAFFKWNYFIVFFMAEWYGIVFLTSFLTSLLLQVYKNRIDFPMLVLCLATLLNSFINYHSFLVKSLGFSTHKIMSPTNRDCFASVFYSGCWKSISMTFCKSDVGLGVKEGKSRSDSGCQSSVGSRAPVSFPVGQCAPGSLEQSPLTGVACEPVRRVSFPPVQGKPSSQADFVW